MAYLKVRFDVGLQSMHTSTLKTFLTSICLRIRALLKHLVTSDLTLPYNTVGYVCEDTTFEEQSLGILSLLYEVTKQHITNSRTLHAT